MKYIYLGHIVGGEPLQIVRNAVALRRISATEFGVAQESLRNAVRTEGAIE